MSRLIRLSYATDKNTPLYPGTPPLDIKRIKAIKKGDSCNTFGVTFSNHSGTHIDGPGHFHDNGGKASGKFIFEEFRFKNPLLADCPKKKGERIEISDFKKIKRTASADIILIRTGFSIYRKKDPEIYSQKTPYLAPETAEWLRNNCPGLKAIGIDCISISSPEHKEAGRLAHKILLKRKNKKAVFIIEDMFLPKRTGKFKGIIVLPMLRGGIDSAPCAVIGINDD